MPAKKHNLTTVIPQTRSEAEAQVSELGRQRLELERIETKLKDDTQTLKEASVKTSAKVKAEIKRLEESLSLYGAAHRDEITGGKGSKSGMLGIARFEWRQLSPNVTLKGVDDIISRIRDMANDAKAARNLKEAKTLMGFLRVKTAINKEAMLASKAIAGEIKGVTIASDGERLNIVTHTETTVD